MLKTTVLSTRAQKDFKKLPNKIKERIRNSLKELGKDSRHLDIKKLKGVDGREDLFRLRVGDYRITYFPDEDLIKVIRIDHRSKAYSWLD